MRGDNELRALRPDVEYMAKGLEDGAVEFEKLIGECGDLQKIGCGVDPLIKSLRETRDSLAGAADKCRAITASIDRILAPPPEYTAEDLQKMMGGHA